MILADTLRNAIADAVDSTIGTTATCEFQTAASAEVATLTMGNPAFGAASSGAIALTGTPSDSSATGSGSNVTKAVFKSGGTTTQLTLTVGVSASEINFSGGVVFGAGDTVTLSSLTITCPAS